MKKIFFSILSICITMIIGCFNVIAIEDLEEEFQYIIEKNEVKIIGGHFGDNIIPSKIEGYPVTTIANRTFVLSSRFTSITLPETLVTIEKEAVLSCENIKEITIPRNVQNIGEHALGYEMKLVPVCGSSETYIAFYRMDDFIIKGYKGTAAETYALQNRFTFIALDDEPITTTTTVTTDVTTTETTVVTTQTTAICTTSAAETTPITTTVTIPEIKEMPMATESLQQATQHLSQKSLHSRLFQERR